MSPDGVVLSELLIIESLTADLVNIHARHVPTRATHQLAQLGATPQRTLVAVVVLPWAVTVLPWSGWSCPGCHLEGSRREFEDRVDA